MIFVFDRMALSVWCESGDDSIAFKVTPSAEADIGSSIDTSHFEHWKSVIGKSFGWGWITINQQGYCDGLLISFEGTHPQLLLTGMASSLAVSIVARTVD